MMGSTRCRSQFGKGRGSCPLREGRMRVRASPGGEEPLGTESPWVLWRLPIIPGRRVGQMEQARKLYGPSWSWSGRVRLVQDLVKEQDEA